MKLLIDCEFNDPTQLLLSMALVSEDGKHEFYEVIKRDIKEITDDWVVENVVPILNKPPIPYEEFQDKLKMFLTKFPEVEIIADHPNDIGYMTRAMITGNQGEWFNFNRMSFTILDAITAKASVTMHNALSDARALRDSYVKLPEFER